VDENFSKFIEMLEAQDKKRDKKRPKFIKVLKPKVYMITSLTTEASLNYTMAKHLGGKF
jgi:predicted transcriptional regulator